MRARHGDDRPGERSLERLKHLDDVSNIDEQLAIASGWCNHAHRSDMIVRWLLAKLTSQEKYRARPTAWILLTTCIRLLQPASLSSRLKGASILGPITKALQEASDDRLIICLNDVLTLVLSITASGPSAARQLLSAESSLSAEFFAAWTQSLLKLPDDLKQDTLATALQIWALRRSSSIDDQVFTNQCLLPAALLLTQLQNEQTSLKRSQDGARQSQTTQLECLIAKHVFLRSRTAFFKGGPSDSSLVAQQMQQLVQPPPAVFPTLLNIAIKCGSINTQRQMLQEVAWNDAVFAALVDQCNLLGAQTDETILHMLDVIQDRSRLSLEGSRNLIMNHGRLEASVNWSLIIKVVAMNPRTFSIPELYNALFDAVARARLVVGEAEEGRRMVKLAIILPLMKVFAEDRLLPEFLDLWQAQLTAAKSEEHHSVWFDLDGALESLLEEHLTQQQIVELVQSRLEAISTQVASKNEARAQISALCVLTSAVLRGIKATETLGLLEATASTVYQSFEKACVELGSVVGFWKLALRLLDLCAPRWSLQQLDNSKERRTYNALHRKLFKVASRQACAAPKSKHKRHTLEAALFAARICDVYGHQLDNMAHAQELLSELITVSHDSAVVVLVRYPSMLALLQESDYKQLWHGFQQAELPEVQSQALQEIALAASLDYDRYVVRHCAIADSDGTADAKTLDILIHHPKLSMGKDQYGKLVKKSLSTFESDHDESTSIQRLVLVEKLLSTHSGLRSTQLSLDDIWLLCSQFTDSKRSASLLNHSWAVVGAMTKVIVQQSDLTLQLELCSSICSKVVSIIPQVSTSGTERSLLAPSKVLVTALEALSAQILSRLDQQQKDVLQLDCDRIFKVVLPSIDRLQQQSTSHFTEHNLKALALSALLEISLALSRISDALSMRQEFEPEIQTMAALVLTKLTPVVADGQLELPTPLALLHPAIRAYQVMCTNKKADPLLLAHAASRSLDAPFTPTERAAIIKAYTHALPLQNSSIRPQIIQSLLAVDHSTVSASALVIARFTLHSVQKTNLTTSDRHSLSSALLRVVKLSRQGDANMAKIAFHCLNSIIQHNAYLVNQYMVEELLSAAHHVAATQIKAEALLFLELCDMLTALLKHHRARLNGRFHVLFPVLQTLLARLLAPASRTKTRTIPLSTRHAHAFSRVLRLLCDPPQVKNRNIREIAQDSLIDQTRRIRVQVGSFVSMLLHSYCSLVLKAPPREGITEALKPGLWAAMGAMEISDIDSMKILSSAMTNSERSVLRGSVEQWRVNERWNGR